MIIKKLLCFSFSLAPIARYRRSATTLAKHFDFSGGQIENVARKHAINSILYGNEAEMLPVLEDYCRCEQLNNNVT